MKSQNCKVFITLLIYFALFGITKLIAQEKPSNGIIYIEATVLDKETKAPLPFTNIIIENTSIGTMTNEEGKFELTISKDYISSNVIFSFVGYQNTSISVKNFKNPEKLIFLQASSTSLDEIIVKVKNKYKELIDKAITLIPDNYSQENVYLETYYRELTKIDNSYTKFIDAASTVYYSAYDSSYDPEVSKYDYMQFKRLEYGIKKVPLPEPKDFVADTRDQAKIVALRKSNNLQKYKILNQSKKLQAIDSTDLKWLENNEIGGGPLRLTGADKIKRRADFFNPKINSSYLFTLFGRSTYNNKPVYIISFAPKDSLQTKAVYKGEIVIDEQSKAIISYQYQLTKKAKKKLNQRFAAQLKTPESIEKKSKKTFISRTTSLMDYKIYVTFSKYKGKWYLKRIKSNNTYKNTGDLFEAYSINTESEIIINAVELNNVSKFPTPNIFESTFSNPLSNHKLNYNQNFWKEYSALVPTGVVGKALEDLESKSTLQEQFEEKQ
ncbi:carboxypeptidase-like regulatory domain-containing protein [Aquimarina sp. AU474]|uniref:carboxypeptidase-like regulatory domain-containing protein n=1 Tax=Aquimarina sp. AU474 TaxID=2108529 RepID=UPI000D685CE8|nr:carboxypeptidase-like regulatory domain-containing protein [Aquimarina sp. AU474]